MFAWDCENIGCSEKLKQLLLSSSQLIVLALQTTVNKRYQSKQRGRPSRSLFKQRLLRPLDRCKLRAASQLQVERSVFNQVQHEQKRLLGPSTFVERLDIQG